MQPAPCDGAAGLEQAAGMDAAPLGCAGTEQPGDGVTLVPGSGVLRLWGQGCSILGVTPLGSALGSGMLWPWGTGCSTPGIRDALCDGEPKSGHRARAGGARHQPTPSTSAAGLGPEPLPPRLTWEQPQTPATQSPEGHLVSAHAGHPPPTQPRRDQGKGHDGAKQTKPKRLPQPPPAINTSI